MPEQTVIPHYWEPPAKLPRGIPLPPDSKFQKPLMKAIKSHLKPRPKIRGPKKRDVKWW